MADSIAKGSLDKLFSSMPTGSLDRAMLNNLRGFNHRGTPGMLPSNKRMPGLTFFVRPQLNMQKDNLRNVRQLSALLSDNPLSIQTYIRCMLDPRLMSGVSYRSGSIPPIKCPLVDNLQAFIPVLTNNLTTISGWPSISVPTFVSSPGLYNESYMQADGKVRNCENFDISANFRNVRGDPVVYLLYVWAMYMAEVFEGQLVPYLDMIPNNRIDYNTRIYRMTLDHKKHRILEMTATCASQVSGVPIGDIFDVQADKTYTEANHEVTASFKSVGVDYFDPIIAYEFNKTVEIFNGDMKDGPRQIRMMKLPPRLLIEGNFRGYPYIDLENMNLDWYVPTQEYIDTSQTVLDRTKYVDYENEGD